MKAFAYVNATSEKEAVAALSPEFEKALPIGGGQDLLARMKDYITQPDRIVNVKAALESVTMVSGGSDRFAMRMVDLAEHRTSYALSAIARRLSVGTPQIETRPPSAATSTSDRAAGTTATRSSSASRRAGAPASRRPARTSSTPSSAAGRASSCTPPASRCRCSPTARPSASPVRPVSAWCRRRTTSRCRRCRTCGRRTCSPSELLTHVILPAPGGLKADYEVRCRPRATGRSPSRCRSR